MTDTSDRDESPCAGCDNVLHRRGFIERAAVLAAAALLGVGVPRRLLAQMRPEVIAPIGRRASVVDYSIPAADGVQIDRANEVILIRWRGTVVAFDLACPHQRAPLRWIAQDSRFECPKHHSHYTPDGSYISGRSTRAMDRLGISRSGAIVHVDLNVIYEQPRQPAAWKAAQITVE
jgi:nitrite reductase/ring-hydroxylating ferredoxin subunit